MSLFDKMKHLVVEDDPTQAQPDVAPVTPVAQPQQRTSSPLTGIPGLGGIGLGQQQQQQAPAPVASTPIMTGAVDANLTASFVQKLHDKLANSPFNAVLNQFQSTMESLAEAIPEEGNRFRAAMKVLAKQTNTSPEQLTQAYSSLLGVLETEKSKFDGARSQQKVFEVDSRDKQVQAINQQIRSEEPRNPTTDEPARRHRYGYGCGQDETWCGDG